MGFRAQRSNRRSYQPQLESLERRAVPAGLDCTDDLAPLLEIDHRVFASSVGQASTAEATAAAASVPGYSSLPGAAASIYLDFDGFTESSWGDYRPGTTPAFDTNGDPSSFSVSELNAIREVWQRVAEDYAPFNVNVTTVPPASFANRASVRVVIGGNGAWLGDLAGGVGYVGGFYNSAPNSVYVFSRNLANTGKYIADAAAHEAGHAFGLDHQSWYDSLGNKLDEYNPGRPDKAPIMGGSYDAVRSTWWYGQAGESPLIQQADLDIIADMSTNGFGYRADDHGDSATTATPLARAGNQLTQSGIIGQMADTDWFWFDTAGGAATFTVSVASVGPNLDVWAELRSSTGAVLMASDPTASLSAGLQADLAPGRYYVVVRSHGEYGDLGQYTISGADAGAPANPNSDPNPDPNPNPNPNANPSPVHILVTGAGPGNLPQIRVFDAQTGAPRFDFFAFDPGFRGGVRVATGDVDGDGATDIIVGAGAGAGPHVKVFSGTDGSLIRSFYAFASGFDNGLYVAAADFDGDGRADVVVGADSGAGPHVKVFSGRTGEELASFFAFAQGFQGGVRVAAADVDGDGRPDLIAGAGPGAGPHIRIFRLDGLVELRSYFAFAPGFSSGVMVAAGDLDGDHRAEVVVGAGIQAGPHVKVFRGSDNAEVQSFFALDSSLHGGVRVGIVDWNGDGQNDLLFGSGPGGSSQVRILRGSTLDELEYFFAYESTFTGNVFVAGS